MLREMLENVRQKTPRIHCITNYVTMNDCANVLLACGASPIMANEEAETAEITALCDGLTINIGTLSRQVIPAMIAAGKRANELGHPVVLDPVGVGTSAFRTQTAMRLLKEIRFSAIRANASELRALDAACKMEPEKFPVNADLKGAVHRNRVSGGSVNGPQGVDANTTDLVTEDNLESWAFLAKGVANRTGAIVVMTGAIDLVTDGDTVFIVRNGHPMMSRVTGTGCQLSVLTAAFLAANRDDDSSATGKELSVAVGKELSFVAVKELSALAGKELSAAVAAVCAMGVCGEKAQKRLSALDGNASYRNFIIDAVYHLTPEELEQEARYSIC
ncbi:MAG: hydroxyethylthiazole kinase [Clostridiales bacterium]|nr:hydroxyethylthiazole kinase [Clostridiales bacterium]